MSKRAHALNQAGSTGGDEDGSSPKAHQNQESVHRFLWDMASINIHIEDIHQFWAGVLGISGPQWMILMALEDLDHGKGVAVKAVSAILQVDPSFVTTQSKLLEKNGYLRRIPSREDARVVLMSLTDKALKQIANLSARREALKAFVLEAFDDREFEIIAEKMTLLKNRLEKATLMLALEA